MAKIINQVKGGATTTFYVRGITLEQAEHANLNASDYDDDEIVIRTTNKREAASVHELISAANTKNVAKSTNGNRRIELASTASMSGLNHGRTWIADAYSIDSKSLDPSWEGELICYVYE